MAGAGDLCSHNTAAPVMGAAIPAGKLIFSNIFIAGAIYARSGSVREGVPFVCRMASKYA
jgi:hypothetical protein